ncbi:hypothetical protein, partial [Cupriavidus plantarum]|uniref:hypothetical protein n=1 Tax=Cupriavidus plantarum TaxID=942865 RepID=UPI00339D91CF
DGRRDKKGRRAPGQKKRGGCRDTKKKSAAGAALSNGLTDTGSVLQVEETASLALYVRSHSKTIETF